MKYSIDKIFTSESVGEGHPDKIADQISDAILDFILSKDKNAKVAAETFCTYKKIILSGEISTNAKYSDDDLVSVVRNVLRDIGYSKDFEYDPEQIEIEIIFHKQSSDIAQGVDLDDEIGAGDQGLMFGYAIEQTENLMPFALEIAHEINQTISNMRKAGTFKDAGPDMKSQVTMAFQSKPDHELVKEHYFVKTVLVSCQHRKDFNETSFKKTIEDVVEKVLNNHGFSKKVYAYELLINPTGKFEIGGPVGDTGLTGRKIIVDTYGGFAAHGGGAFSGKDATKVDRSAAYLARYIAKNLVAAGINYRIQVQLSYAIGVIEPLSVYVYDFNETTYSKKYLEQVVRSIFRLTPKQIIDQFDLRRPIYRQLSSYGHFGRASLNLPWEKLDKVSAIHEYIKLNPET